VQDKQSRLFDGLVRFSPGVLQQGQGAGLGLFGKSPVSVSLLT